MIKKNRSRYAKQIACFKKVHTRISIKAGTPEAFTKKTGALSESFELPFKGILNLIRAGASFHVAAMSADSRINSMKLPNIFILVLLLSFSQVSLYACTGIYYSDDNITLAGSNLDWFDPVAKIWFIPSQEDKYSVIYFGTNGAPQYGVSFRQA